MGGDKTFYLADIRLDIANDFLTESDHEEYLKLSNSQEGDSPPKAARVIKNEAKVPYAALERLAVSVH